MVLSVSIPGYDPGKPVLYRIDVVSDGVPPYTVRRRYNEFLRMAADVESEMGEPVAVAPPPKPALWASVDLEQRRQDLEVMLTALVRVPEFADSLAVGNFLELYTHRRAARAAPGSTLDWISTTAEISRLLGDARAATTPTQTRQRILQARALASQLRSQLRTAQARLGRGEHARRVQQLDGYALALAQLETRGVDTDSREQLFGSAPGAGAGAGTGAGRVLGETDATRELGNRGLVQQQQDEMAAQDEAIAGMLAQVSRQKEIGLAIHGELAKQNEMLEELDGDVHRVNARLNEARRKTARLSK